MLNATHPGCFSPRPALLGVAAALTLGAGIMGAPGTATASCGGDSYTGSICVTAATFCPEGYLVANGAELPINNYQALFSLLGFSYGGDGSKTFRLPDLRGHTMVGQGKATINNVTHDFPFAKPQGSFQTVLAPTQVPLPQHTHQAAFKPTVGKQDVTIAGTTGTLDVTASLPVATTASGTAIPASGNNYLAAITAKAGSGGAAPTVNFTGPYTGTNPGSSGAQLPASVTVSGDAALPSQTVQIVTVTGGDVSVSNAAREALQAVSLLQPVLPLNVCIMHTGFYPPRP